MTHKKILLLGLLELIMVLAVATVTLRLWDIDFHVPFNYHGDTVWYLLSVKGMLDNGWTYDVPQLSAPFSLSVATFPSMTTLDWGIMKIISLFTKDIGAILNIFWLFSIVLTAWAATLTLRLLGIRNWLALGLGLIYSFIPYTLMRNTGHIALVFYCVPILSLFAIHLARGGKHPQATTVKSMGYLACLAQGLDYIYYSFFAVLLFFFGGIVGYRHTRSWKLVRDAMIACGIIILSSAINLLPSYLSWHKYGKPPDIEFKAPQEAEIFGIKLRQMLAPHESNLVPIFSQWGKRDHSIPFPNENENVSSRLGPLAALGFLFLLAISLGVVRPNPTQEADIIKSIASLVLFSFLVTTVGGFGAIINEVIGPDIRCYNRFSVFISFLSIAGLGLWLETQLKAISTWRVQPVFLGGIVLFMFFSLYDQLLNAVPLSTRRPTDEQAAYVEKPFVNQLEAKLPSESFVFELPITGFPCGAKERMFCYDHVRPYLWSSHLHWSWPSLSPRHRSWQAQIEGLEGEALVEALVLSKFRAVWIDRFGYADNGTHIISSLVAAGAIDLLPNANPRYVALSLEPVAIRMRQRLGADEFARRQATLLDTPGIEWVKGVYPEEYNTNNGKKFHWSRANSVVQIRNPTDASKSAILSFLAASGRPGGLTILIDDQRTVVPITGTPTRVELPLALKPNAIQKVQFKGDMGRIPLPPGETRDLHYYLMDLRLTIAPD